MTDAGELAPVGRGVYARGMYLVVSSFCGTVISIVDLPCWHSEINKIALFYLVLWTGCCVEKRGGMGEGIHSEDRMQHAAEWPC